MERLAVSGLAVEAAVVADVGIAVAQRDIKPAGEVGDDPGQRFFAVDVLMGVNVGRIAADKFAEAGELTIHLGG